MSLGFVADSMRVIDRIVLKPSEATTFTDAAGPDAVGFSFTARTQYCYYTYNPTAMIAWFPETTLQ